MQQRIMHNGFYLHSHHHSPCFFFFVFFFSLIHHFFSYHRFFAQIFYSIFRHETNFSFLGNERWTPKTKQNKSVKKKKKKKKRKMKKKGFIRRFRSSSIFFLFFIMCAAIIFFLYLWTFLLIELFLIFSFFSNWFIHFSNWNSFIFQFLIHEILIKTNTILKLILSFF